LRHCRGVSHIDSAADRGGSVGGQLGLCFGDRLRGAGAVGDDGALGQQSLDDRTADAARAAGDRETLARQSEFHEQPLTSVGYSAEIFCRTP
jgi:hypothetical protein